MGVASTQRDGLRSWSGLAAAPPNLSVCLAASPGLRARTWGAAFPRELELPKCPVPGEARLVHGLQPWVCLCPLSQGITGIIFTPEFPSGLVGNFFLIAGFTSLGQMSSAGKGCFYSSIIMEAW